MANSLLPNANKVGALGSILPDNSTQNNNLQTVPVYQIQPWIHLQTGQRLQDVYGTSQLPMFNFAKRVQTGEITFDPSDQFHQTQAEALAQSPEPELAAAGIDISTKDMITSLAQTAAGAVVGKAGQMAPGFGSC